MKLINVYTFYRTFDEGETAIYLRPALLAGGLTFVLYFLTLEPGAFPGRAASMIAQAMNAAPAVQLDNPVLSMIAKGVLALTGAEAGTWVLNLFSAVCASIAVMLLFRFTALFVFYSNMETSRHVLDDDFFMDDEIQPKQADTPEMQRKHFRRSHLLGYAGGIVMALALVGCFPFWLAGTHFQVNAFDAMLASLLLFTLQRELYYGSKFKSFTGCFITGLALFESPCFLIACPLALVAFFLLQLRDKDSLNTTVPLVFGGFAGGVLLSLGCMYLVTTTHLDAPPLLDVLLANIPFNLTEAASGVPMKSAAILLAMTVVPALFAFYVSEEGFREMTLMNLMSHLVFTAITLCSFTEYKIIPWRGAVSVDVLPAVSLALAAATLGYLFCFWLNVILVALRAAAYVRANGGHPHDDDYDIGAPDEAVDDQVRSFNEFKFTFIPKLLAPLCILAILWAVIVQPMHNHPSLRQAAFADKLAAYLVEHLNTGDWLFSAIPFEGNLLIQAKKAGKTFFTASLNEDAPMEAVSSQSSADLLAATRLDPTLAPFQRQLELSAEGSYPILLSRLVNLIPGSTNRTAVLGTPTPLLKAKPDVLIKPYGPLYRYVAAASLTNAAAFAHDTHAFATTARDWLDPADDMLMTSRLRSKLRNNLATSVNMAALLLERTGHVEEANTLYLEAEAINPGNQITLINRYLLTRAHPELKNRAEAATNFTNRILFAAAIPPTQTQLNEEGEISSVNAYLAALQPRFVQTLARNTLRLHELYDGSDNPADTPFARLVRTAFFFLPLSGEARETPLDKATAALCLGYFDDAEKFLAQVPADDLVEFPASLYPAALAMVSNRPYPGLDTYLHSSINENPGSRPLWLLFLAYSLQHSSATELHTQIFTPLREQGTAESRGTLLLADIFHRRYESRMTLTIGDAIKEATDRFEGLLPLQEMLLSEHYARPGTPGFSFTNIAHAASAILADYPDHPMAFYMAGAAALNGNDLPRARFCFERSFNIRNTIPSALALASLLRYQKDYDEAVILSAHAHELFDKDTLVQLNYVAALLERGDRRDIPRATTLMNKIIFTTRNPAYNLTTIRLRQSQQRFFEAHKEITSLFNAKIPLTDIETHQLEELLRINEAAVIQAPVEEIEIENTFRTRRGN